MIDIKAILAENRKRTESLVAPYDPYLGIGSPIERFEFYLTNNEVLYLPVAMKEDDFIKSCMKAGSALKYLNNNIDKKSIKATKVPNAILRHISEIRINYDFEYWAVMTIKIKDKESGTNIPFKLNRGQRRLLASFERQRLNGIPIRVILVKARQWGGSTLTEFYATWLQTILKKNWNSVIIGDVEDQAKIIRGMYSNAARQYPEYMGTITMRPFEGSIKTKIIEESGSIVSIGSMQQPDSLRSQDIKIAHLSEVGLWKKTLGKAPIDLIQSVKSSIPYIPGTMIVEESTAKGVGNYFHKAYKRAKDGESNYDLVFVAWYDIERNRIKFKNSELRKSFIKKMSEYDWWMWSLGATLEGINWYKTFQRTELGGDEWVMRSENPNTAQEAFQSTGHRVFKPQIVIKARENCTEPIAKGTLFADAQKGKEALNNISFEETKSGELWIWAYPDKDEVVSNRYVVSVDIGGVSKGSDWSVIRVVDKYWMIDGGVPEMVATLKIHIDQDLLAWLAAQVATWYNNALLVVENNSLRKDQNTEGNGYLTILNEVSEYYDNIYKASKQDVSEEGFPIKYGFHTNSVTKPLVINNHKAAMRDDGYIERDSRALDEADMFEHKPGGTMGAVDGEHDDIEMSSAIGLWVAVHDSEKPVRIDRRLIAKRKKAAKKRIKSAASF